MKIMTSYRHLMPIVGIPLLLVCSLLSWFFNTSIGYIFQIHWIALLAAIILAVSPRGKESLATTEDQSPTYRWPSWLARIVSLQLCFFAIFWGMSTVCGETAPVLTTTHPHLFFQTLKQLLCFQGLFPWAFFALLAIAIGRCNYRQNKETYLATLLGKFAHNRSVAVSVNFIARLSTILAYGMTIGLISLLWASAASDTKMITGFSLTPILTTTLLLVISLTKIYKRHLGNSLGKDISLIPGLFTWIIFLAVAIWLLNGFLEPITNISLAPPTLLAHWMATPWLNLWGIFANSWWLFWLPLMGFTIARLSRGYRVRDIILAVLGLPLIISLCLIGMPTIHWTASPWSVMFIAGLGLLGLLIITLQKTALPTFVLCYVAKPGHHRFRSYRSTLIKSLQIGVGFLFIYLPSGMTLAHILAFSIAIPLLIILCLTRYY